MAQKVFDRVRETFSTTGTGTITVAGAVSGFRTFGSVLSNAETCAYAAEDTATGDWEVGIGTYSSNTLARTTVLASSNGGSAVSWSAGTKQVFITVPADGINAQPVGNRQSSTGVFTTLSATGTFNYGVRAQQTSSDRISVSTATTIFSIATGGSSVGASACLLVVNGYEIGTTTNSFIDLVLYIGNVTPVVVSAANRGSPAARTYTTSGINVQLAMASGTYNVASSVFEQAN